MTGLSYRVLYDRDDDAAFADDLTAAVLMLDWRLGMGAAFDAVAMPSQARIVIRNRDGDATLAALVPGRHIAIEATHDGVTRRMFCGMIAEITPEPGTHGEQTATIRLEGPSRQLSRTHVRLAPQQNVSADAVIAAVLDTVPLRRVALAGRWLLGHAGHSELGTQTRLPAPTLPRALESGLTQFAYVGDTWGDGVTALDALREVVEAESGRLIFDRDGGAVFLNRHHTLLQRTCRAAFDGDMQALRYSYGDDIRSRVQVTLRPRHTGTPGSVLWESVTVQALLPGETRRVVARFRDADARPAGALAVLHPAAGGDYYASAGADGTGDDLTALIDLRLVEMGFSAATLELRNRGAVVMFLHRLRLRGTPLITGDPVTIAHHDPLAEALYGPDTLHLSPAALDSMQQADDLARFTLGRRRHPRGTAHSITITARTHPAQVCALTLFDRIAVRDAGSGCDHEAFIIAEAHRVEPGGTRHTVTYTLEPAAGDFWLVGRGRLGVDTTAAY